MTGMSRPRARQDFRVVVDTVDPSSSDADKLDLIRYSGFQMLAWGPQRSGPIKQN